MTSESDHDAIAHALSTVCGGHVFEIRALDATERGERRPMSKSGYFDDAAKAAEAVCKLSSARGIYFTPNPVNPDLLARCHNRLRTPPRGESTSDSHIVTRRWLLVDFDAKRASGISASNAEHAAALQRARDVYGDLRASGWPEPLVADSGNGAHLLYRIDLPADDGGLVSHVLQSLDERFSDDAVGIDTAVSNPARIWKLYGTWACKGDDVPERPHRLAKILHQPAELLVVSRGQLEALAGEPPEQPSKAAPAADRGAPRNGPGGAIDLDGFIQRHKLDVTKPRPWGTGGRAWSFNTSPLCEHHDRAAHLEQHASGAVSAGCHHNSCSWGWRDLRAKLEPHEPRNGTHHAAEPARNGTPRNGQGSQEQHDAHQADTSEPKPNPAADWQPFPVDALPHPLREYVETAAEAIDCDPVFIALPLLSGLASAVGNARVVRLKRKWTEP